MKRKLMIYSMILAMTIFWLPSEAAVSARDRLANEQRFAKGSYFELQPGRHRKAWYGKRKRRGPKWVHGYRNYGQYRKTQVGKRRYHLVRRPFWRNGIRVYRSVRIYY